MFNTESVVRMCIANPFLWQLCSQFSAWNIYRDGFKSQIELPMLILNWHSFSKIRRSGFPVRPWIYLNQLEKAENALDLLQGECSPHATRPPPQKVKRKPNNRKVDHSRVLNRGASNRFRGYANKRLRGSVDLLDCCFFVTRKSHNSHLCVNWPNVVNAARVFALFLRTSGDRTVHPGELLRGEGIVLSA